MGKKTFVLRPQSLSSSLCHRLRHVFFGIIESVFVRKLRHPLVYVYTAYTLLGGCFLR